MCDSICCVSDEGGHPLLVISGGDTTAMSEAREFVYYGPMARKPSYIAPTNPCVTTLKQLLSDYRGVESEDRQLQMFRTGETDRVAGGMPVYFSGNAALLGKKCVSIVGTRDVSEEGYARAARLAKQLVDHGVVVVSGLAKGVDTAALSNVLDAGGKAVAVIGTPLDKAYPAENKALQQEIWQKHLLMTPFGQGETVFKSNFPKRNRLMAAVSDATVIVEASDTSGTLHQAHECQRLGRPLFIMRSVVEDVRLKWPSSFLKGPNTFILQEVNDILTAI